MGIAVSAPAVVEPGARFRDLVAAEWLKLWSLRSTAWAYSLAALAVVAFNAGEAWDTIRYWSERETQDRARFISDGIPLHVAFTDNAAAVYMLAVGALGAVAVTGEYGSGLIRTTFTAVPARGSVMAAKAVVLAAVATGFGAVVAAVSFWVTQTILHTRHAGVPLDHPGALRIIAASALLAPVCALTGLALGALIRHGATSMVASFVVLVLLPVFLSDRRHWSATLLHSLPNPAWQRLRGEGGWQTQDAYPWTMSGAWTVYAVWSAAAAAVAVLAVRGRDQ